MNCQKPDCLFDKDASVHTMTVVECDALGGPFGPGCFDPSAHHPFAEVPASITLDTVFLSDSITFVDDVDMVSGAFAIHAADETGGKASIYITKAEARRLRDWLDARA